MEQTKLKESTGEQLESTALNGGQEANKIHTQRFCRKCLLIDLEAGKEKEIVYGYISEPVSRRKSGGSTLSGKTDNLQAVQVAGTGHLSGLWLFCRSKGSRQKEPLSIQNVVEGPFAETDADGCKKS